MKYLISKGSMEGRDMVRDAISLLDMDKSWSVEIKPYRKRKTADQLRYYHGLVVRAFTDVTGYEHEDMHQFLLGECFGWIEKEIMGRTIQQPARTLTTPRQISREDMTYYIDWCIAYGAKRGIIVPDPREVML